MSWGSPVIGTQLGRGAVEVTGDRRTKISRDTQFEQMSIVIIVNSNFV